jgi:hypothetical protein
MLVEACTLGLPLRNNDHAASILLSGVHSLDSLGSERDIRGCWSIHRRGLMPRWAVFSTLLTSYCIPGSLYVHVHIQLEW